MLRWIVVLLIGKPKILGIPQDVIICIKVVAALKKDDFLNGKYASVFIYLSYGIT